MQPLLKCFDLVSDPLVYDAATGVAAFQVPQRLQGNSRCAIIGISATDAGLARQFFNNLEVLNVAGRQYHQGAGVPLALLTPGRAPSAYAAAPSVVEIMDRPNYFPGEFFSLSDGNRCGGLMLYGQEVINIQIRRMVAGNELSQIVLHCLEFGIDCPDRQMQALIDAAWQKFKQGVGQVHWQVFSDNIVAATAYQAPGAVQLQQPHESRVRRRGLRGATVSAAVPQVTEIDFVTASVQVNTNTQPPHSSQGIPARQVMGHGAFDWTAAVEVDLNRNDYSIALFNMPAPTISARLAVAHMFEGVERQAPKLCGPGVF